jgi:hypothetical protein
MADRFSKLRTTRQTPSPSIMEIDPRFQHLRNTTPLPSISPTITDRFDTLKISTTPVPPEVTERFTSLQTPRTPQSPVDITDRFNTLIKPQPLLASSPYQEMMQTEESPGGGRFSHLQVKTDNYDQKKKRDRKDPIMSGAATRMLPKKLIVDENTSEWEIAAAKRNGIEIEEKLNMESETQFPDLAVAIAAVPTKKPKAGKKPVIPKTKPKGGAGQEINTIESPPKSKDDDDRLLDSRSESRQRLDDDDDFLSNGGKVNKSPQKKPSFAQLAKEMAEKAERERLEKLALKAEEDHHRHEFTSVFTPHVSRQGTYNSLANEYDNDNEEADDFPLHEEDESNGYY